MSKYDDILKTEHSERCVFEQRYCINCKYGKQVGNKIYCSYSSECPKINDYMIKKLKD